MAVVMVVVAIVVLVTMVMIVIVVVGLVVVRRHRGANAGAGSRTDNRAFPSTELVTYRAADGATDTATNRCVDRFVSECR
jgi:hypothetical protein